MKGRRRLFFKTVIKHQGKMYPSVEVVDPSIATKLQVSPQELA